MDDQQQTDAQASAVTRLLEDSSLQGSELAEALFPLVYAELKAMARARMARERDGWTLTPTALVHDAYLRLTGDRQTPWQNRRHFFGAAAEAMRRILIDAARRRATERRGGGRRREGVTDLPDLVEPDTEEIIALDEALARLEVKDEAMAAVVKLRYFAGLTVPETAEAMEISPRSVDRLWSAARAWLLREMEAR